MPDENIQNLKLIAKSALEWERQKEKENEEERKEARALEKRAGA